MGKWMDAGFKITTMAVMLAALYAIFLYAPVEKTMGVVQKIFYFHVSSAFLAFLAFLVVFIASILYLLGRDRKWDILAHASAEIGVVFCTLVLITGPIWAKPVWNVWWTWDPRLTTTLVLWFVYVSYLILRKVSGEGQGATLSAVFGIIAFANVPLTFFAIRIWRTIHPLVIRSSGIGITPPMLHTLMITLLAFTCLYVYLLRSRVRLEKVSDDWEEFKAFWKEKNMRYQSDGGSASG